MKNSTKFRSRRPQFETLERRDVMTGVSAALSSAGVLNVTGTTGAEQVYVLQTNNTISLKNVSGFWSTTQVKSIVIDLKGGSDTISLDSLHNGGNKALAAPVTVKSGSGTEVVTVVTGHQVSLSGAGHTLVVATGGAATLDGKAVSWSTPTPPAPTPPTNTNWFDSHITDAALKSLGHSLFTDNLINRSDMISLLRSAEDGGIIDATEMTDLKAIVANTSLFGASGDYVDKLAADVVNGSVANAKYLGQTLGNLAAGATDRQNGELDRQVVPGHGSSRRQRRRLQAVLGLPAVLRYAVRQWRAPIPTSSRDTWAIATSCRRLAKSRCGIRARSPTCSSSMATAPIP